MFEFEFKKLVALFLALITLFTPQFALADYDTTLAAFSVKEGEFNTVDMSLPSSWSTNAVNYTIIPTQAWKRPLVFVKLRIAQVGSINTCVSIQILQILALGLPVHLESQTQLLLQGIPVLHMMRATIQLMNRKLPLS
jgi:hypothetical protein